MQSNFGLEITFGHAENIIKMIYLLFHIATAFSLKQHVPSNIRNKTAPQREQPPRSCRYRNTVKTIDSAIGQHLLDNPDCAKLYYDDIFRIIGRARSSFHLAVSESIYFQTKKPSLCRQKEFVFSLGLQW